MARQRPAWHQSFRWEVVLVLVLLAALLFAPLQGLARAEPPGVTELSADPLAVGVGLHVRNLYGLSLEEQTFKAEGWYWLKVPQAVEELMERRGIQPLDLVEFVNQVDNWDGLIKEDDVSEPRLSDGSRLLSFRFSATFYVNEINLHRSPFEEVRLPLILEISPDALADPAGRVRLLPEAGKRGLLGDYSSLYGYRLRRVALRSSDHRYPTRFGSEQDSLYSRLELLIDYQPQPWAMFTQWILPLLLVMCLVLLAPSLEGTLGDARLAIPPTALLTLVFLQQTYKAALPPTDYLTFLDLLYTYGYAVSVGLFVLFLWASNQMEAAPEQQRERVMRRINRVDLRCQIGAVIGFLLVALFAWFR
jgi:hypothetical protein